MKIEKNLYLKNTAFKTYCFCIIRVLEKFFLPIILFLIRLQMASIFWYSGLSKISDWSAALYIFKYEYKVPHIPSELAAHLSTTIELSTPILLVTGLMTRLACVPMLFMAIVIQFTYIKSSENIYWMLLLGTLICQGPGKISIDYLIRARAHLKLPA